MLESTYDRWKRSGRTVSADQLRTTDAQLYIWCVGPDVMMPKEVYVLGWSTTAGVRREHDSQRYTGSRGAPVGTRSHQVPDLPRDDGPVYDLNDPEFDEVEWHQTASMREPEPPPEQLDPQVSIDTAPVLPWLLANDWREGDEPRPGRGPGTPMIRVRAAVRPLPELLDWIRTWVPDSGV